MNSPEYFNVLEKVKDDMGTLRDFLIGEVRKIDSLLDDESEISPLLNSFSSDIEWGINSLIDELDNAVEKLP